MTNDRTRIVVIGGVAGGASAAARARRLDEQAEITLIERGPEISFANCGMPYHVGGVIADRDRLLVQTPEGMRKRYRIDVRTGTEALRIDRKAKLVVARRLADGNEFSLPYDKLILSPGAAPVRPPIPGLDSPGVFSLRSLADMDAIKSAVDSGKPRSAVVIGGGYIGLEMAEALRQRKVDVTLVELASQVFVAMDPEMAEPLHQQLSLHGVDLRLGTSVVAIEPSAEGLGVRLSDGSAVRTDIVIAAIGVRPEATLARGAGLELGTTGGIAVDDHMHTSDPDIFAVGDVVEVRDFVAGSAALIPLAGPANRQGRIAADNALGGDSVYRDTQGTAICKVFDTAAGMTGLSEKQLKRIGLAYEKVYVHPSSHASYYPGAAPMSLKLLFDPADGRVLGAQAVGAKGVDKRIDVLAVAIRAKMTVFDLKDLELSYAPPYGSAKDPVNYAGFVAANVLEGKARLCHVEDIANPGEDQLVLDVRTTDEAQAGTIAGALNVPLDELRQRLGELPRDKELLVFCQAGLRGYVACCILGQNGFACRNLSGGYKTYQAAQRMLGQTAEPDEITSDSGEKAPAVVAVDQTIRSAQAPAAAVVAQTIDARAMQCPGPIMRLKTAMGELDDGQAVEMLVSDPGFASDVKGWCRTTGHHLQGVTSVDGHLRAVIVKKPKAQAAAAPAGSVAAPAAVANGRTIVVFSDSFDRAMASFIIANGAAAMGSEVTMFFTFWGLNILKKPQPPAVSKNLIERMLGWMMPRGPRKLSLSKLHMAGAGTAMMKGVMRRKNVATLEELIDSARKAGVKMVACTMTMELMGIDRRELIDGVSEGGVAHYLDQAGRSGVNLFI